MTVKGYFRKKKKLIKANSNDYYFLFFFDRLTDQLVHDRITITYYIFTKNGGIVGYLQKTEENII